MAKVKLPSYLIELSGRMEDAVIYKSGNKICIRTYVKPRNPRTEAQQKNRSLFAEAMAEWKKLPPEEKSIYRQKTRKLDMLPHNLFVKEYLRSRTEQNREKPATAPHMVKADSAHSPYELRMPSEASPFSIKDSSHSPCIQQVNSPG